jgi:hypothetical protein
MNSKILVFALSALGIVMAFFMGRAAGQGQLMHIALVFGVMIGAPLLLSLGKNYWYLIPASLLSGLPAVPFGGRNIELAELSIILCFGIFISRVAFKLDKLVLWRATHIPIYLYIGWVLFIFCLYPVGLAVFGAATMGARFYAQLVLAFIAFIIIASREITEKDCKWIIIFILVGSAINATYSIASFLIFGPGDEILNPGADTDGFYTWHQSLAGPALAIIFLLFAWKKPSEILGFKKPILLLVYLIAIALTLYSGKRMALIAVFLAPIVSAAIYRQYTYIFSGTFLALILSLALIFGHGDVFKLPPQMQRALSWLPAKWDSEFYTMAGGRDPFREALRRFAMENIDRYPIVGRGFAIEYSEIIGQVSASRYLGGDDMQAAPYAIGRAWHNTWLGYAADFGIPLSVIQGILYLAVLIIAFKTSRAYPFGSLQSILAIYILIFSVRDVLATHTSGHSATDAYNRWWMYGLLFSLYAATKITSLRKPKAQSSRELFLERMSQTKSGQISSMKAIGS